ncbi:MAG: hypothetical protein IT258_16040 [Saprospiraceae bacterium]|nr:hypothetical protein [Saprospiraceae bacterium]
MKNKTQLSVRPVRRTKKTGYPSWQEPNPLEQPYAQPYPFTQKALNWLAASGLCGALFFAQEAEGGVAKKPDKMERMDKDTLGNPFPFERMGVPFRTSAFGTGVPERLTSKEAQTVIDSVFRAEGIRLEKTVIRTTDGFVEVDGYDAVQKIGYVWIDWGRMDSDMYTSWMDLKRNKDGSFTKVKRLRFADNHLRDYDYSIKKIHEAYSKYKPTSEAQKAFIQKLKNLIDNGSPDWDDDYKYLYYEYILAERVERFKKYNAGGFSNITEYMEGVLSIGAGSNRNKQLDIAIDVLAAYKVDEDWLAKVLIEAAQSRHASAKLKRLNKLQEAYQALKSYAPEKQDKLKHLIIDGKDDWKPAVEQAEQWLDELKISMVEAKALEAEAYKKGQFVALISQKDERWIYRATVEWVNQIRQSALESIKRQAPKLDSIELEKRADLWYGKPDYSDTKEYVLKNLENQVHDYIRWAKQQRGY